MAIHIQSAADEALAALDISQLNTRRYADAEPRQGAVTTRPAGATPHWPWQLTVADDRHCAASLWRPQLNADTLGRLD